MEILRMITHTDGGEDYLKNLFNYLCDDRMVIGKAYGVNSKDSSIIADEFLIVAKFFGNANKNLVIHYVVSFSRETAPDEWTAFRIVNEVLQPLIEDHIAFVVVHKETRGDSDCHVHIALSNTNYKDGTMIQPNNKLNFFLAERVADITGKKCAIEPEYNTNADKENKKKFYRVFSPQHEL